MDEVQNDCQEIRPEPQQLSGTYGRVETRVEMGRDVEEPMNDNLREIRIEPLNSGFIVRVGCQSAAIETNESLLKGLKAYLEDPRGFEKKWFGTNKRNKLEIL